jgi:hypothetical protein
LKEEEFTVRSNQSQTIKLMFAGYPLRMEL